MRTNIRATEILKKVSGPGSDRQGVFFMSVKRKYYRHDKQGLKIEELVWEKLSAKVVCVLTAVKTKYTNKPRRTPWPRQIV